MLDKMPEQVKPEQDRSQNVFSILGSGAGFNTARFFAETGDIGAVIEHRKHPTVLIVDDQLTSRRIISEILLKLDVAPEIRVFGDPEAALNHAQDGALDLLITDYKLPKMSGIELMHNIRALPNCDDVPALMITTYETREIRYQALTAGVNDVLVRPLDQQECHLRCRNLLKLRKQQQHNKIRLDWLERQVGSASNQIRQLEKELLMRLARAGEYRDEVTGTHVLRMAKYARLIAEGMGMSSIECEEIELAAPMHDIGKIGIPDEILRKSGQLTDSERAIMCQHTWIGYEILKDSPSRYMQIGAIIALNHHERFDGLGYPNQLYGDDIPISARIVAVADVYDALTTLRPYKRPWSNAEAVNHLQEHAGGHFDPACVKAFMLNQDRALEIGNMVR